MKYYFIFFVFLINLTSICEARSKFLLVLGPSGVGKSTIINQLKILDDRFEYISPLTTRDLREGEDDKIHVSEDTMDQLEAQGSLLTKNYIYGIYYGTPKKTICDALDNEFFPVLDWPVSKIDIMKSHFKDRLLCVYIFPPNIESLADRLAVDGRDENGLRFQSGVSELSEFEKGNFDNIIDLKIESTKNDSKTIAKQIYSWYLKNI